MAAAKVHPVPCVLRVSTRGPTNSVNRPFSNNRSTTSGPSRCPPFTTTAPGFHSAMRRAASRMSSRVRTAMPASTSASGMFGVTTRASRSSVVFSACAASWSSNWSPLLATITGSTTRLGRSSDSIAAATTSTMAEVASMPVLTASQPMSAATASICAPTNSAGTRCTPVTPRVFCAVRAVTAEVPYTPWAAKVLRSAWMPAPPPESEPAIVRAVGIPVEFRIMTSRASTILDQVSLRAASASWWTLVRVLSVAFVAGLTAAAAQVSFPLPFTPVPFTIQPMVVLLGAAALGSRLGALSQVAYLLAGVAGVPVFAFAPELPQAAARLLGPSGGYLMAYPLAAFVTGYLAERGLDRRYLTSILAMAAGLAVIFVGGVSWLSLGVGLQAALATGLYPFVLVDAVKVAVAGLVLPSAWALLRSEK